MLKIVYDNSEKQIDKAKTIQLFRKKYIKGFEDEDLFLNAICEAQYLGFKAGIKSAKKDLNFRNY